MLRKFQHLSKFIAHLRVELLRQWLEDYLPALNGSDPDFWNDALGKKRKLTDVRQALKASLSLIPEAKDLNALAERLLALADAAGEEAWHLRRRELVEHWDEPTVAELEAGNAHERALKLYLKDEREFRRTETARFSNEWRSNRMYHAFKVPEMRAANFDDDCLDLITQKLNALLGARGNLIIEPFEQEVDDIEGGRSLFHLHVFHPGLEQSYETIVDHQIKTGSYIPANQSRYVYDPVFKVLEVFSRLKDHCDDMVETFYEVVLGKPMPVEHLPKRNYTLEILRSGQVLANIDQVDAGRIDRVDLMELRFDDPDGGAEVHRRGGRSYFASLHEQLRAKYPDTNPLDRGTPIQSAKIVIRLRKEPKERKGRTIPITISLPNRCNIRNHTSEDQRLAEKYLSRWKLILEEPADVEAAALEALVEPV